MNAKLLTSRATFRNGLLATIAALAASSALAGRPLNVDDAGVNDKGKGHVEAWVARADGFSIYSLAPAYAAFNNVEFGGLFQRESETNLKVMAVQVKWRITPSQENGCNFAAIGGLVRAKVAGSSANGSYATGLFTCNGVAGGGLHMNLGLTKANGSDASGTWGIAYDRPLGPVTPHIEWYGTEGGKPTIAVGLRGQLLDNLQLDGSVGRNDGVTLYTLGAKFTF